MGWCPLLYFRCLASTAHHCTPLHTSVCCTKPLSAAGWLYLVFFVLTRLFVNWPILTTDSIIGMGGAQRKKTLSTTSGLVKVARLNLLITTNQVVWTSSWACVLFCVLLITCLSNNPANYPAKNSSCRSNAFALFYPLNWCTSLNIWYCCT